MAATAPSLSTCALGGEPRLAVSYKYLYLLRRRRGAVDVPMHSASSDPRTRETTSQAGEDVLEQPFSDLNPVARLHPAPEPASPSITQPAMQLPMRPNAPPPTEAWREFQSHMVSQESRAPIVFAFPHSRTTPRARSLEVEPFTPRPPLLVLLRLHRLFSRA